MGTYVVSVTKSLFLYFVCYIFMGLEKQACGLDLASRPQFAHAYLALYNLCY